MEWGNGIQDGMEKRDEDGMEKQDAPPGDPGQDEEMGCRVGWRNRIQDEMKKWDIEWGGGIGYRMG